ncbi:MAG: endonuclease/exonuclease/phosphatase family protein [Phocaeicola sp.]
MKYINRLVGGILLAMNALCGILLLFCAYRSYIHPTVHPASSGANLLFPIFLLLTLLFLLFWLIVYKKNALCSAFFLLCTIGPIRTYIPFNLSFGKPDDAIKVLSYNAMGFQNPNPKKAECPKEMLNYLQTLQADIICFQEFPTKSSSKKKEINQALKEYPYKNETHIASFGGLACYSRYPILSAKRIKYASESNGSVAYQIKIDKDTILVINNHLESNKLTKDDKTAYREMLKTPSHDKVSKESRMLFRKLADASIIRADQADSIAKLVAESKAKGIIVCGDFNNSPLSYAHRVISKNLTDAFVASGCGLGISYNQNYFFFRIDHILTNDYFKSFNCTVDRSIKSSDHYPVWCYLKKSE